MEQVTLIGSFCLKRLELFIDGYQVLINQIEYVHFEPLRAANTFMVHCKKVLNCLQRTGINSLRVVKWRVAITALVARDLKEVEQIAVVREVVV